MKVFPPDKQCWQTGNNGFKKGDVLNKFFASLHWQPFFLHLLSGWTAGWGMEEQVPPTVRENQVQDHLRKLNVHNSMGPKELHPRVLRELIG